MNSSSGNPNGASKKRVFEDGNRQSKNQRE